MGIIDFETLNETASDIYYSLGEALDKIEKLKDQYEDDLSKLSDEEMESEGGKKLSEIVDELVSLYYSVEEAMTTANGLEEMK